MISLKDALQYIKKRDYRDGNGNFSAAFMLCNRHKQTGGEILVLENACACPIPPTCNGHAMVGIKDMETGKPYAVHNYLLFQLNGQEIYWV